MLKEYKEHESTHSKQINLFKDFRCEMINITVEVLRHHLPTVMLYLSVRKYKKNQ